MVRFKMEEVKEPEIELKEVESEKTFKKQILEKNQDQIVKL